MIAQQVCVFGDASFQEDIQPAAHLPAPTHKTAAQTQTGSVPVHELCTQWPECSDAQCGAEDQVGKYQTDDSELTALMREEAEQRCAPVSPFPVYFCTGIDALFGLISHPVWCGGQIPACLEVCALRGVRRIRPATGTTTNTSSWSWIFRYDQINHGLRAASSRQRRSPAPTPLRP